MTDLYRLQEVRQSYGSRQVLAVDDLGIDEGETLALIGPSGSGKSTLLRLLCLLERPTSGELRYDGRVYTTHVPLAVRREVTLVFQRPMVLDMSVEANVAYGLRIRGRREVDGVRNLLDLLGLTHLQKARALTLSGGEMQRVALARAMVIEPRVLLLDEPTANLDPQNVTIIEAAIRALHARHHTTILIATHNVHQAQRLTRRAAMLLDGRLIEVGATSKLLQTPADTRTVAFVDGSMVY